MMSTKKVTCWISRSSSSKYRGPDDLEPHFVSPLQTVIIHELFPLFTIHIGDGLRLEDTHIVIVVRHFILSHGTHDESPQIQRQFVNE